MFSFSAKQFFYFEEYFVKTDLKIKISICTKLYCVTEKHSLSFFHQSFFSFHSFSRKFLINSFSPTLFCFRWKIISMLGLSTLCAWLFTLLFYLLSATSYIKIIVRHTYSCHPLHQGCHLAFKKAKSAWFETVCQK